MKREYIKPQLKAEKIHVRTDMLQGSFDIKAMYAKDINIEGDPESPIDLDIDYDTDIFIDNDDILR